MEEGEATEGTEYAFELSLTEEDPLYWVFLLLTVIPMARIFFRAGFHWLWGALCFIPIAGPIVCWCILAARDWRWRGRTT